jgi:radical SAM protein with 4Fe4S-binding SPASM domain
MEGELLSRLCDNAEAAQVPLEVLFEITHRCNLPCAHCYLPEHADKGELTLDEIAALFDQLAQAGTVFLTLTGGEILSRRDFTQIVDLAYERGFALKLLTNATLMTDELARFLTTRNVLQVAVSVYGATADVHDRVTGIVGSFVRTRAGIERMLAAGLRVVLKTPLMTLNGDAARDVHQMAAMMHMPCNYDFSISSKTDGSTGPLALQLAKKQMIEILAKQPFDELFAAPYDGPGPGPCAAGKHYCAIGPTGDVMPCIMMPARLGNVRERAFAGIWSDAPFLAELRALSFDSLTTCRSCDVKGACQRCPGQAMHLGQGAAGCDLTSREVAKAKVAARRLRVLQ